MLILESIGFDIYDIFITFRVIQCLAFMPVKQKKEFIADLNTLRANLMSMQAGIIHEDQIPKASELRAVVAKLELMIQEIEKK